MNKAILLDCTLRDGGYYNAWDFSTELVNEYLRAMKAAGVDIVELGFRFIANKGFKGPNAYTTDSYLCSLDIPEGLAVGVMINGSDMLTDLGFENTLHQLFPHPASETPVSLIRFACHYHEFERVLPAVDWLHARGYRVGFNLMQITDRTPNEVSNYARKAKEHPVEVLYFADSMGSMTPADTARIIRLLREVWDGPIGVHTHDNMGLALSNTMEAVKCGATWLDATVTGMGRGPGNARTEELAIEVEALRPGRAVNFVPLMSLIKRHFEPMKAECGWGTNPFYYLSGKYGIHPTYVQEMLADPRYDEEDILAVIDHLRTYGGKKFSLGTMEHARNFYAAAPVGTWSAASVMADRDVLILGTGPGVARHRAALESYIRRAKPLVLALNTQSGIDQQLIDLRIASHPVRLLADAETHLALPQPLICPASMLPEAMKVALAGKEMLDFGLGVSPGRFAFAETHCEAPTSLVLALGVAAASSGRAARILMAGFDGYPAGDARNDETAAILDTFGKHAQLEPVSVTPTRHRMKTVSIYAMET